MGKWSEDHDELPKKISDDLPTNKYIYIFKWNTNKIHNNIKIQIVKYILQINKLKIKVL